MSDSGVTARIVDNLCHINLRGNPDNESFMRAAKSVLGDELPRGANRLADGDPQLHWLGPDEWLILGSSENAREIVSALTTALDGVHSAVNDLSGSQLVIRLRGDKVDELLTKGCTLDLHAAAFGAGSCAQTGLAKASMLLVCQEPAVAYDVHVRRSFSDYAMAWLQRSGAEYGIEFD